MKAAADAAWEVRKQHVMEEVRAAKVVEEAADELSDECKQDIIVLVGRELNQR